MYIYFSFWGRENILDPIVFLKFGFHALPIMCILHDSTGFRNDAPG